MATAADVEIEVPTQPPPASARSSADSRYTTRHNTDRDSAAEVAGNDRLSRALGWFSIGLGLAQVVAPTNVARLAGAEPTADTVRLMRALGLRELSSGIGILSGWRTQEWMQARVAGDIMDLALLGRVLADDSSDRGRTIAAGLAVAGVTALDLLAAKRAGVDKQERSHAMNESGEPASTQSGTKTIRRAITINRPPGDVAAFWREHARDTDALDEHVRFVPAPGGRGTEVHLLRTYDKPGKLASLLARARHQHPDQLAFDELLAMKQIIETGDIVISDAWINGPSKPHAAQPE